MQTTTVAVEMTRDELADAAAAVDRIVAAAEQPAERKAREWINVESVLYVANGLPSRIDFPNASGHVREVLPGQTDPEKLADAARVVVARHREGRLAPANDSDSINKLASALEGM